MSTGAEMGGWPAIIVTDADGTVTAWNRQAEVLYGWAAAEALGRSILELAVQPANSELGISIMDQLSKGRPWQGEFSVARKDGSKVRAFVRDVPVMSPSRQLLAVVGISFSLDDPDTVPVEVAVLQAASNRSDAIVNGLLWSAPVGLALFDTDLRFVRLNERLAEINGLSVEAHLGRSIPELLPNMAPEVVEDLREVLRTGKPVVDVDVRGETPAAPGLARDWLVSHYPVRLDDGSVVGLGAVVVEVTERRAAEAALAASEARLRLALDAARMCTWDWDLASDVIVWDERHTSILGVTFNGARCNYQEFVSLLHPDDRAGLEATIEAVLAERGTYERRYRTLRPNGGLRWLLARGQVVTGANGRPERMTGVLLDVTETHSVEERVARTLESMTDAFLALDRNWVLTYVNREAERVLLRSRDELEGRELWEAFPEAVGSTFWLQYHRAMTQGVTIEFTEFYAPLDVWFEVRAYPTGDGLSVYFHDVTARRKAEAAAARGRDRLAFLAEASLALDSSLDYGATLERVARLCVPFLGDACVVDVVETGERRTAVAAIDPHTERALWELRRRYPTHLDRPTPPGRVLRNRRTEVYDSLGDAQWRFMAQDRQHYELLASLGLRTGATVPLLARGRSVGAISVGRVDGRRALDVDDCALLEDLGRRGGLAIDNSRQYCERVMIARKLQAKLLPAALPSVPGLTVAARYLAAGDMEVGGDFYDLFASDEDGKRWTAVVGDVTGKARTLHR